MVFKRNSGIPGAAGDTPGLRLDEEMVRKSLSVNPALRQGRETRKVLRDLQDMARRKVTSGSASDDRAAAAPNAPVAFEGKDPRLQTIDIFMRDRTQSFADATAGFEARVEAVRSEQDQARRNTVAEILELVGVLLLSGADTQGVLTTLRRYRDLLCALKISEADIVDRARKR